MTVSNDEILSELEIEARFPDQWVLVQVLEWDVQLKITRGIVRAHGADQQEIEARAVELALPQIAFLFTGRTENLAFLL